MAEFILLIVLTVWLFPGIIGGSITALAIKWADRRVDAVRFATIMFGWAIAMVIGGIIGEGVFVLTSFYSVFDDIASWIIGWGITGMITALVGSWITNKALESVTVNDQKAG